MILGGKRVGLSSERLVLGGNSGPERGKFVGLFCTLENTGPASLTVKGIVTFIPDTRIKDGLVARERAKAEEMHDELAP